MGALSALFCFVFTCPAWLLKQLQVNLVNDLSTVYDPHFRVYPSNTPSPASLQSGAGVNHSPLRTRLLSIFFIYMAPFPDSSITPTPVFSEIAMNQGLYDSIKALVFCVSAGEQKTHSSLWGLRSLRLALTCREFPRQAAPSPCSTGCSSDHLHLPHPSPLWETIVWA